MILGFTGTREGMTNLQESAVAAIIWRIGIKQGIVEAHHGDCLGADAQFHAMIRQDSPETTIVGHPPSKPDLRAYCDCDELREPKPYLVRNADIVRESDEMVATPKEMVEQFKGGTWFTIHEAKRQGKRCLIVWPNGRTEQR